MSTFNVHEWNRKRYLSEEEEQVGERIYLVMVGKSYQAMGPVKAFTDKVSAEKHAIERKQEYNDRFGDILATQVLEIPIGK